MAQSRSISSAANEVILVKFKSGGLRCCSAPWQAPRPPSSSGVGFAGQLELDRTLESGGDRGKDAVVVIGGCRRSAVLFLVRLASVAPYTSPLTTLKGIPGQEAGRGERQRAGTNGYGAIGARSRCRGIGAAFEVLGLGNEHLYYLRKGDVASQTIEQSAARQGHALVGAYGI